MVIPTTKPRSRSGSGADAIAKRWKSLRLVGFSIGAGTLMLAHGVVAEAAAIGSLRTWVAPGFSGQGNPTDLADWFSSTSLWIDTDQNGVLETVSTGVFDATANSISNPNIQYSKTNRTFTSANGFVSDIWQVDFTNLGLDLSSSSPYRFGVKGVGRSIPGSTVANTATSDPDYYPWFLVGANAAGAGLGPSAFADDRYYEYKTDGTLDNKPTTPNGVVNSITVGEWDKTSDILVQVRGTDGSLLTDRGLPTVITLSNMARWAPPESIYAYPLPGGGATTNQVARFKGDDFKVGSSQTVPESGMLFGIVGATLVMLSKKCKQLR